MLLAASVFFAFQSAAFAAEPVKEGNPIQVHGDTVEYLHENQKIVGTGHVSIDYEGANLKADKITVYLASKTAVAEGNVVLTQEGSVFKGERGEYDFARKVGNVAGMTAVIPPAYYAKADRIERVSEGQYRAVNGCLTTCAGDQPFYQIQAQQIDVYPEDKVVAKNALVLVKGVPVFFIPYYVQPFVDFERFPVQVIPGHNSEWGTFLLSKWRYHLSDRPGENSKGNILLDYRTKRGFAGGVENFYRSDTWGRGAARVYYANDENPPSDAATDRYRAQWRHQSKLGEDTTLTTELNKLGDRDVIKDFFFREEYERDVFPDNYVSIITAKPEYTFSILERERLDDFFPVVERSPEVRFDTHNRQFSDTPFYFREEIQFSNLKKQIADLDDPIQHATRLDANHTLSYAGRLGDVSIVPHVGTRQTYYSRRAEDDTEEVRGTFDGGVDVSTRFYKTYDVYLDAFGLDINKIRHIFVPTASYNYRPNPTVPRTVLGQFDALDAIDKGNFVRLNFENKLQTKSRLAAGQFGAARELARVIPFLDYDFHTGRIENVGLDAELRPYTWLAIESDLTYDSRSRDIDTANFDVVVTRDAWSFAVGQRYVQEESSQTTLQARWRMNELYEFKVYERFEWQTGDSKEFETTVSRYFDCVVLDVTYNHRDNEDSFFFMLRPRAFAKSSFDLDQSYTPPKTADTRGYRSGRRWG